jgi:D-alanine-D-alanine ligase
MATQTAVPRTFGPVSDLERHLPADWWKSLFNSLYLKTDGDVVEREENTVGEVDLLIKATGLERNDRFLDLCCGQGRHSLELARRGYSQVVGLDRSRYLIRLARRRAARVGLNTTFHEGDARKLRFPPDSFDCIALLGNSFGYFEREADDMAVLNAILRSLRSHGQLVLDITDGEWVREHFEPRSWEWIDENHFVCRERALTGDGQRLLSREVIVHAERGVIADQFYAERLYSRNLTMELLEQVGFRSVRDHGVLLTGSDRNQDLGMMARRLYLTAQAPRKAKPNIRRGSRLRDVTVLLGDPSLPDPVKRDARFNPEDLDTTRKLKDALSELDEYRFNYIDNHASLVGALRGRRPEFVFNLCDEGFNNDPFMELHIPALLEMLGTPYTGAGPACLAICYDKALTRSYAQALDIPVPLETSFSPEDHAATIPSAFPAIVKPNYGDGSIGITRRAVVNTSKELMAYLQEVRELLPARPVLIQEFLMGAEYSVALLGNPGFGFRQLPILEVDYSDLSPELPRILEYGSKWLPDSPYWSVIRYQETSADEETKRKLYDYSTLLFERLGCRDYARFDFRADAQHEIKLLEVNPNTGWCWDGKLNLMAGFAGMRYSELLTEILHIASERVELNGHPAARPVS